MSWGQIRPAKRLSWHRFATWTRVQGQARSVCNRNLDGNTVRDDRPQGENTRTCERCWQLADEPAEPTAEDPTLGVEEPT